MNSAEQQLANRSSTLPAPKPANQPLGSVSFAQPPAGKEKSILLDQAYSEYCRLQEKGQAPDPTEFCGRFPALFTSLRRLLEAHHFFEENAHLLAEFQAVSWPEPGTSFLGFSLLRELGRGAFARVFLATEPALGHRQVAVKISLQGGTEAETLGRLDHPNIVPVFSVQEDKSSGLTLVCMPYLGNATLCDVLDHAFAAGRPVSARTILDAIRGVQTPDESMLDRCAPPAILRTGTYVDGVVMLALQLADALAFIHERGVCHRDLKPSNVLLAPDGRPMLLDFNLSADERADAERIGGTVPYMAPEQLRTTGLERGSKPELLDARSDLFSLGVLLYELLTGRHPFGPIPVNLTAHDLRKHLLERQQRGCVSIRELNWQVSPTLSRLIERCLAYEAHDRPQSAQSLVEQFKKHLSWPRRWRRRLALRWRSVLAGSAALIIAVGACFWCFAPRGTYSERQLQRAVKAYQQGEYPQALQYVNHAIESDAELAQAHFLRGRAQQKMGSLASALIDYQEAIQKSEENGPALACAAYCRSRLAGAGAYDEAVSLSRAAIDKGFAPAAIYNNLGYCYLRLGQLELAKSALDKAIHEAPTQQAPYHLRAKVDLRRVMMKPLGYIPHQGIADIDIAMKLGPQTAELYHDGARLCGYAARVDKKWAALALEYVEKSIYQGLDPNQFEKTATASALAGAPRFAELMKRSPQPKRLQAPLLLIDPVDDRSIE